jgi:hypothetical protein
MKEHFAFLSYFDNKNTLEIELDYQFQKNYIQTRNNNGVIYQKI